MSALHNLSRANNCVLLEKLLEGFHKKNIKLGEKTAKSTESKPKGRKADSEEGEDQQLQFGSNNINSGLNNLSKGGNMNNFFLKPRKTVEDLSLLESSEEKNESTEDVGEAKLEKWNVKLEASFIDKRDSFERTPLHLACYEGHLEAAKLLIKYGANVQSHAKNGMTCLHFASQKGHLELVKLLCKHGIKVNTQTNNCMTALHFAISNGHVECALFLINKGAKQKYNKKGELPLDMASEDVKNKLEEGLKDRFTQFKNDVPKKRKVHKETVKFYKRRKNQ
ncbi:serine/threonine-protein kinase ripk4 [Theileria orientalis]|uniref:Serine/threonine-protein kinase ripk4 n=1 Tax=Theileria orientalis TaxID=68886 RepID=A0A976QSM8_THEOR|nr:serine/threonine-protein kinase ripk4 [Theileria orientalis]